MANSKYDFHKLEEKSTDLKFNKDTYIIVRIDGDKFHDFSREHNFHKPNDKRALDLMIASAKHVMQKYKGHIPLAYGHSDEFSFLIKSTSNILSRRVFKITSMLPVIFATFYNSNWDGFFGKQQDSLAATPKKYDAWFDARPKEYANCRTVIDYFRWRQVDCHINNLYNTTLHALTGRYLRHEFVPLSGSSLPTSPSSSSPKCKTKLVKIDNSGDENNFKLKRMPIHEWISESSKFLPSTQATERLSKTVSSDKHDIMFLEFGINYNDELEQFKKGTVIVDVQRDYNGTNDNPDTIKHFYTDLTKGMTFWKEHRHIFPDYVEGPSF